MCNQWNLWITLHYSNTHLFHEQGTCLPVRVVLVVMTGLSITLESSGLVLRLAQVIRWARSSYGSRLGADVRSPVSVAATKNSM